MFNADFYPTPRQVIEMMISDLNLKGKVVLEPSAGSGSILSALKEYGAKTIACEQNPDLAKIAASKCDQFLGPDFMQIDSTQVSHINYIIANPPFSCADKHIIHMWDIAPSGCEIVSLCNSETIQNPFSRDRRTLESLIEKFGSSLSLGQCFSDADRKTDVEVSMIKLYKPKTDSDDEFSGYFDLSEEYEHQENGIMQHSEIREIVSRYVGAVRMFNEVEDVNKKINTLISPISSGSGVSFGAFEVRHGSTYPVDRENFKKRLQKSAWMTVFNRLNMQKYVTKSVMENINKFVEQQVNVPFTLVNIYKMIEMIVGTHGDRMNKVITDVFDQITEHHHENRHGVEGWKTNDCFMVNRRFILGYIVEVSWSGNMTLRYNSNSNTIEELTKALCYLTGTNYDTIPSMYQFFQNYQTTDEYGYKKDVPKYLVFGQWYEYGFLRLKGYKKGTIHCEFLDPKIWEIFNVAAVKAKGWRLPTTTKHSYRAQKSGVEIY